MDHGIGVGIVGVDPDGLREPRPILRLDRREAEARGRVTLGCELDPERAEDADAVEQDDVVVGPDLCGRGHRLSSVSSATAISTIAGNVFTSAPSGSIQRSGVRIAVPTM